MKKQLYLACISDIHGNFINIDKCDILLIAGDIIPTNCQFDTALSEKWFLNDFKNWIINLQCKTVYFIAGNHDFYLQHLGKNGVNNLIKEMIKNGLQKNKLFYVEDELITLENGKTLYGCPWCEGPTGWAFSPNSTIINIAPKYDAIPNCDILLCHQPPTIGKLGCSYPNTIDEEDYGSDKLREVIYTKNIKIVVCGHIHSGLHNGLQYPTIGCDTIFYNVCILDEDYDVFYLPTYLTI